MRGGSRSDELAPVTATLHPTRLWLAAGAMLALLAAAALALSAGGGGRGGVLRQLERPAIAGPVAYPAVTVGPGPLAVHLSAGAYAVQLRLRPNRASARDTVSLALTRAGRPVSGAAVSLAYSMPSMGMPTVLGRVLRAGADGSYRTVDPQLAMPGTWRLTFKVTPAGSSAFTVIVDDRMTR
jgi:YtkA-like